MYRYFLKTLDKYHFKLCRQFLFQKQEIAQINVSLDGELSFYSFIDPNRLTQNLILKYSLLAKELSDNFEF